jgi:hypothetical protein
MRPRGSSVQFGQFGVELAERGQNIPRSVLRWRGKREVGVAGEVILPWLQFGKGRRLPVARFRRLPIAVAVERAAQRVRALPTRRIAPLARDAPVIIEQRRQQWCHREILFRQPGFRDQRGDVEPLTFGLPLGAELFPSPPSAPVFNAGRQQGQ